MTWIYHQDTTLISGKEILAAAAAWQRQQRGSSGSAAFEWRRQIRDLDTVGSREVFQAVGRIL